MNNRLNSCAATEITVVTPEFSLFSEDIERLEKITSDAFRFASHGEYKILFGMRKVLQSLRDTVQSYGSEANEYINRLYRIQELVSSVSLPSNTKIIFPGVIKSIPVSEDEIQRLIRLGGNITLPICDSVSLSEVIPFLEYISREDIISNCTFNLIHDLYITPEVSDRVYRMLKHGKEVTLCSKRNAVSALALSRTACDSIPDTYDGILTVPGKTVLRVVPLDYRFHSIAYDHYLDIKDMLCDILDSELAQNYKRTVKGRLYRRKNDIDDTLYPLTPFYHGSVNTSSNKISGILSGGAEYDTINFSVTVRSGDDDAEKLVRGISAACIASDSLYPFMTTVSYKDIRQAESIDELKQIIAQHTKIAVHASGGALLDLIINDIGLFSDPTVLSYFLNDFFMYGGITIKIRTSGGNCDK